MEGQYTGTINVKFELGKETLSRFSGRTGYYFLRYAGESRHHGSHGRGVSVEMLFTQSVIKSCIHIVLEKQRLFRVVGERTTIKL
jgi:hypothetical protein